MNMVDWNYLLGSHSVKLSSDYLRGIAKTISGSKNYRDAIIFAVTCYNMEGYDIDVLSQLSRGDVRAKIIYSQLYIESLENPNVNYKDRCATALQIVRDMRKATYSENAAVIELQAYLTWLTGDPSAKEIASEALALDANRPLAGMVVESVSKGLYPACVA